MRRKSKIIKFVPVRVRSKNGNPFGTLFVQKQLEPVTNGTFRVTQPRASVKKGVKKVGGKEARITTELSTNSESLLWASNASKSD